MTAAKQRRRNDGSDRARDREARQLLLEDVFPEEPQPLESAAVQTSAGRSVGPFAAALLIALALAGVSWAVASLLTQEPTDSSEFVITSEVAEATDLLFRVGGVGPLPITRLNDMRREVFSYSGRVQTGPEGEIESIEVDASRLRALLEALEADGLGTLHVVDLNPVAPEFARGGDWDEWSTRLGVRRALRRAERLDGMLIVRVQESG